MALCGECLIFIVSPHDEWQAAPISGGNQRSVAPVGCVGGKLERGEFPHEAVRREITEETSDSVWHVPGRTREPYAFLTDGSEIAWDERFGMPGMTVNPDWVIIEEDDGAAGRMLYGFAATVAGDPLPSGGHPALLYMPWRLLSMFRNAEPCAAFTGAELLASGGRIVPGGTASTFADVKLMPIGTARFLCALDARAPRHPLLSELGMG